MDDDAKLLAEYVNAGSQEAFANLVGRHSDWVYSASLRMVRQPQMAEEVTQATFIVLAKKAAQVKTPVSAWLFRTARFAAKDALKIQSRRQRHEQRAAAMASTLSNQGDNAEWLELVPHLEAAVGELSEGDRQAILLRFYEGRSVDDTAMALGISHEGAKKRISRSLEKLRRVFSHKGVTLSVGALAATLTAHSVQAAPACLASGITAASSGSATGPAAELARRVIRTMLWQKATVPALAAAVMILGGAVIALVLPATPPPPAPAPAPASAEQPLTRQAISLAGDPTQGTSFLPGWPLALPGSITGTPVVADLDGDGKLEVVVPCMHGGYDTPPALVHPEPNIERLLFAFRADGSVMPGWPVVIMDEQARLAARQTGRGWSEDWASSPSVVQRKGGDQIVILNRGGTLAIRQVNGRPEVRQLSNVGDGWASAPVVDLHHDGKMAVILGRVVVGLDGGPVPGWPKSRTLPHGFAPAIGDANGDGRLEIYHPHAPETGGVICGYDDTGTVLEGWPRKVGRMCLFGPVMGDVDGDGRMEIVAADQGGHILAYHWDGTPLLEGSETDGECEGVFKSGIEASLASPTLADLDGDGVAEIIVFDRNTRSIKAWHGNGKGVYSEDGTVAQLPKAAGFGGVTVAELGGEGVMDFFVGTYWVRVQKDGRTTVTNMLPEPQVALTQCTITDLDQDGIADVVFGLEDGRVFAYRTGKAYKAQWMQWPTSNGNFAHTGAWASPAPRQKRIAAEAK